VTRYLISFDEGAMAFPEEDLPAVADAAHAVVQEAMDAGVWVFGGGLNPHEEMRVVATDGAVSDGPFPESKAYIGGFSVVDVPSREEALEWAAKIAVARGCAQGEDRVPGPTCSYASATRAASAASRSSGRPRRSRCVTTRLVVLNAECRQGCSACRRRSMLSPVRGSRPL